MKRVSNDLHPSTEIQKEKGENMEYYSNMRPPTSPHLQHSNNQKPIIRKFLVGSIILMLILSATPAYWSIHCVEAETIPVKPKRFSSLYTNDRKAIRNDTFWKLIKDNIKDYKDMIFMFGQCYGGGFVSSLPNLRDTVAMSASKYDQRSWGWCNPVRQYSEFLEQLRQEIELHPGDTADQFFSAAKKADTSRNGEIPQISPASGNDMKIHDGTSNYVIMWGGITNEVGEDIVCWNDLESMYGTLRSSKFGYRSEEITVLFGDGTYEKPDGSKSTVAPNCSATLEHLETEIKKIAKKIAEHPLQETLLFWSSPHGDNDRRILDGYKVVSARSTCKFSFNLTSDFITAVSQAQTWPSVEITQQGIVNYNTAIYVNDRQIGVLNPTNATNLIYFDKSLVSFSQICNSLSVISGQNLDFTVSNITLDSGAVPTQTEVDVGGIVVPIDKLGLLAPYIGFASTILVATVAVSIYAKRGKSRKEKH